MATPFADPFAVAASYNRLVHRIADRDPVALADLHRHLVIPIFEHVQGRVGDIDAAVAITRAAFVEVWRLAPARRRFDDARGWLFTIADRRIAEHARAHGCPSPLGADYDEHMSLELEALIRCRPAEDSGVTPVR
jgi:DNA-directed RNA polymerase specialized sigma24 family protein